jgi:multidrug efflux pump subunit AcrA (membrane-fusion protein)
MVARCSVRGNRIENALYIPVEAAHSDDRGAFVWVDSLLGRPAVRRVVLGRHTPQFVEVREGLRERERVRIADPE